jgi:hypothetical protein
MGARKRTSILSVIGLLAALAVGVPSGAAQAAAPARGAVAVQGSSTDNQCPLGYLCVWSWFDYTGKRAIEPNRKENWGASPEPECWTDNWSNCALSIWNNGKDCEAEVWDLTGSGDNGGASWVINRGTGAADLTEWPMNATQSWALAISSNSWRCPR